MRSLGLALCLGLAVLAGCEQSATPTSASPAASAPLSNADQPTVKGAGASAAPSGQVAGPAEDAPVVVALYRQGHEVAVLRALAILVGLSLLTALLVFGVPRRFRRRALIAREDAADRTRARAA